MMLMLDLFDDRDDPIPDEVYRLFDQLSLKVIARGYSHFSADAILHQIRWTKQVEYGDRDFKCNNNWTAKLARWFMKEHPEHKGFFRTRKSREDG